MHQVANDSPAPTISREKGHPRIFGLDAMRATAITAVLLAHGLPFLYPHFPRAGYLGHFGSVGVDIFFVLSGFLIGGILLRMGDTLATPAGLAGFWLRRWFRTLPNFFIFVLINIAICAWLRRGPPGFSDSILTVTTFTENLTSAPRMLFFPESWTLAVEEWFYLLAPALILVAVRLGLRFSRAFLVVTLTMMVVPVLLRWTMTGGVPWDAGIRLVTPMRLDSLATGLLAAFVAQHHARAWRMIRVPAAVLGLVLAAIAYMQLFQLDLSQSFYARTLMFTQFNFGYALMLPLASTWTVARECLPVRAVRGCALWSYSIYLCNWLFHVAGVTYFAKAAAASLPVAALVSAGFFACSFAGGALAYHGWEKRLTSLRNRFALARDSARPPVA